MSGQAERSYSRTFTGIETKGQERPRKVLCIPVKQGVTASNVLAIAVVPILAMLISTYVNA